LSLSFLSLTNLTLGRLGLSSNLARTAMSISGPTISLSKLILPSTFSKACPEAISRHYFFLTMHQAIKNEPWMQYQHGRWGKVGGVRPFPLFFSLPSTQHRRRTGHTIRGGCACNLVSCQMATPTYFTFQTIIPPCWVGSKGWNKSSRSAVCGQLRASRRSVKTSAACQGTLIAAVGGSFFHSWTSSITNLNFKNSSSPVAIFVTSI
jgi:hypothetical protein